jgi:hypothetical protein
MVQSQLRQIVCKSLSLKKKKSQKRACEVAQGIGPEFKPQHCKKKKSAHFFPFSSLFHCCCPNPFTPLKRNIFISIY